MRIKRFLIDHSLDDLYKTYGIVSFRNKEYPNLVGFKYSIKSNWQNKICHECRGIILDESNNWNIVCYPYKKFFNYNEGYAAKINWKNSKIFEKLDGSMICLWYYNGWHVSTTGSADAGGFASDNITFADLFKRAWEQNKYKYPNDYRSTYLFELMTPFNQIVVKSSKFRLVLHGARDNDTLKELDAEYIANRYGYEYPQTFHFSDLDSILSSNLFQNMNGDTQEGFVVVDNKFNRVKIKCADYILKHKIVSYYPSVKDILSAITGGIDDDLVSLYPELTEDVNSYKQKLISLVEKIEQDFSRFKDIEDQKTFALSVKDLPYGCALFSMRKMGISALAWAKDLQADKLKNYLES